MRVIFPTKSDFSVLHADQSMVGDGHPMRVAGQIVQHMFRTAEGLPDIHYPLMRMQGVQESRKRTRLGKPLQRSVEGEFLLTERPFKASQNLPRKTTLSTSLGKKKPALLGRIQRSRPGAKPPAGTTQWMCGWWTSVWPQVCSTHKKPSSAPRRFGLAATSSSVSATQRNSWSYNRRLFWSIN